MHYLSACLESVLAVRKTVSDNRDSYLFKTRLHRSIILCGRLVAVELGLELPEKSCKFEFSNPATPFLREIIRLSNSIYEKGKDLGQPSEPTRIPLLPIWESMYQDILKLENVLRTELESS